MEADRQRLRGAFRQPNALYELLARRRAQQLAKQKPVLLPPGDEWRGASGPCWRRLLHYAPEHQHGDLPLGRALQLDSDRLVALGKDEQFRALQPANCLFLDTETTGLSGGVGTVVFAFGMAYLRDGQFVLEQLFLRDFGEEQAMLEVVAQRMAEYPVPVTFVGKTFDRHRIHARMSLYGMRSGALTPLHLDLYYAARRAFGKQLPNVRLRTVEEQCLGLRRVDDLPGSEAPDAFFSWLRDRTGPVDRVLEHNRLDVLSLIALLGLLAGVPRA